MIDTAEEQTTRYTVVHNDEEQYSVWWEDRPVPAGWHRSGFEGTKEECLAHIDSIWTDMRPRSLREFMRSEEGNAVPAEPRS